MVWVIAVICVFAVIIIAKGAKIVPQAKVIIVERLGKYHCTLQSGFNIIVPIIDKPRKMETRVMKQLYDGRKIMVTTEQTFIDLRETVHDFPKQNVITKDNVVIEIDAILYYQITDPFKAMYEISNLLHNYNKFISRLRIILISRHKSSKKTAEPLTFYGN